jgi:hypothetical protein
MELLLLLTMRVLALNSAKLGLLVAFGEGSHGIGAEMYSQ